MYKIGVKTFNDIQGILMKYIADLGGVKYIKKNLHKLDDFLTKHPVLKRLGGVAVAGILLWIWLSMSYSPVDVEWSMSFDDMLLALAGKFSLADLFATDAGITMLIYLAGGMLLGGVPYPGGQAVHLIGGVLYSMYKVYIRDKSVKIQFPQVQLKKLKPKPI